MIEEFCILGALLEQRGLYPEVLYHRTFLEQNVTSYKDRITAGEFEIVWLTMPQNNRRAVPRNKMKLLMRFYSILLTAARLAGTVAVLTGMRNTNWMDEHLVSLCQDGVVESHKHSLCRLGLSLQKLSRQTYRSGVAFNAMTTFRSGPSICNCEAGIEHVDDRFNETGEGSRFVRETVNRNVYLKLMNLWFGEGTHPEVAEFNPKPRLRCSPPAAGDPYAPTQESACPDAIQLNAGVHNPVIRSSPTQIVDKQDNGSKRRNRRKRAQVEQAFPTESKVLAKARKAAGHVAKKKKVYVEEHYDDLGDDLSGLGGDIEMFAATYMVVDYEPDTDDSDEDHLGGMTYSFFHGGPHRVITPKILTCRDPDALIALLARIGPGLDICELCGGVGRTTEVAVCRRLRTGRNFDLVTGFDLGSDRCQRSTRQYINDNEVMLVVMAPSCRALGPPSNVNYHINYESWAASYAEDLPHLQFCGSIAVLQIRKGIFLFAENPWPTWLTHVEPWPQVFNHPSVLAPVFDQCRLGLKSKRGTPVKKPTVGICNAEELAEPFMNLRCNCPPNAHDETWGAPGGINALQVWTWRFAERIVKGAINLKQRLRKRRTYHYPEVATDTAEGAVAEEEGTEPWRKCPGCLHRMASTRREHIRVPGICKFPHVEDEENWKCPACSRNPPRKRGHQDHTDIPGECRWAPVPHRQGGPRQGQHPRAARVPASQSSSSGVRGPDIHPATNTPPGQPAVPAPSTPPGPPPPLEPHARGVSSSDPAPAHARGVVERVTDSVGRTRSGVLTAPEAGGMPPPPPPRRQVDVAVGVTPDDWTSFDVTKSLRMLRTGTKAQKERELRKLHHRWWHATRVQMEKVLHAAGVPGDVLGMIQVIIETCRQCRTWAKHGDEVTPSVELHMEQNHTVEADIMFYKQFMIWHMIDRADRWHAALVIESKDTNTLCDAIDTTWYQIWGPFKHLVIDGESGVNSNEGKAFLKRKGIQLDTRAVGQHARMIERRGAILRHAMHCIEEQLETEGIQSTIKQIVAEAVFAGNCLVNHGGASPYQARTGRTPAMLPDVTNLSDDKSPGAGRFSQRRREVALQKMIESTAIVRINRALRSVTTAPGEALDYKIGELVDFWREPTEKDSSGWTGPAKITKVLNERGMVEVVYRSHQPLKVKFGDVRRFIDFAALVFGSADNRLLMTIETGVRNVARGQFTVYGYQLVRDSWEPTLASRKNHPMTCALEHFATNIVQCKGVYATVIGRGVKRLPAQPHAESSVVVWWCDNIEFHEKFETTAKDPIRLSDLVGEEWPKYSVIQFLSNTEDVDMKELANSEIERPEPDEVEETDGRLSTIEEGENEDEADLSFEELMANYAKIPNIDPNDIDDDEPMYLASRQDPPTVEISKGCHYYFTGADPSEMYQPEIDEQGLWYLEMLLPGDSAKLFCDQPAPPGSTARLRCYLTDKKVVIERDTDLLTNEEYQTHHKMVLAAVYEELVTWIEHKCFSRKLRKNSWNVLDVKWVGKWKWVKVAPKPNAGSQVEKTRIIRMRMTLRGFKDQEADGLITFAGTSTRNSQRLVVSEAAIRGWPVTTLDVKKAFLKGISYDELARITGEPRREVNFELDAESVAVLKTIKGYEDFNPSLEVLHMLKPGTGCKDAPRCFSMQLSKATDETFGAKPTTYDPQLIVRHRNRALNFIGTKHVDDIKVGCQPHVLQEFIQTLEQHFGKGEIDITASPFTNCGLRHIGLPCGGYSLDQIEYISALKPIVSEELMRSKSKATGEADEKQLEAIEKSSAGQDEQSKLASTPLSKLYLSLLMALAYALQTRPDLAIYVNAMQRYAQAPRLVHIKRLNALVRWAQKHPIKLLYRKMTCRRSLELFSDAAFKREVDENDHASGRASRGAVFLRTGTGGGGGQDAKTLMVHLVDWHCGSIKQVTRSTFTSEGLACVAAVDQAITLITTLHEIEVGPQNISETKRLVEEGKLLFSIDGFVDAMSLIKALAAAAIKVPQEKSFLLNLLWLADHIRTGMLKSLSWTDTRDMIADGLTKGSVDRALLHKACDGYRTLIHEIETISKKSTSAQTVQASQDANEAADEQ